MAKDLQNGSSFFRNTSCAYFPCHPGADPDDFNCLFCYCPLYRLGSGCGGNFRATSAGKKDCTACLFPHRRENYPEMIRILKEHPVWLEVPADENK